MGEILFSNEVMQYINMASKITKAAILDCILSDDDHIIFIVQKGQMGIAIGKKAKNLEKLRNMFKKTIRFVEYNDDQEKFIKNLFKPYNIKNISLEGPDDNPIAKVEVERSEKSKAIGKKGRNIELIRTLARRHHNVKDVQIK